MKNSLDNNLQELTHTKQVSMEAKCHRNEEIETRKKSKNKSVLTSSAGPHLDQAFSHAMLCIN